MKKQEPECKLLAARIVEKGTPQGPLIYRVEVLYSTDPGWRTDKAFMSKTEAVRYFQCLLEGVVPIEGEATIAEWYYNQVLES